MTDSKAMVVVQRKLLVEIVVPNIPPAKAVEIMNEIHQDREHHFCVSRHEPLADGYHINILCEWRFQGILQDFLSKLAHKHELSFRDTTQFSD